MADRTTFNQNDGGANRHWVSVLAPRERERRQLAEIMRDAAPARGFAIQLLDQLRADLEVYYAEFPNERDKISIQGSGGVSAIVRDRDEFGRFEESIGVSIKIDIDKLVVVLEFTHLEDMNKYLPLSLTEHGTVGLEEGSIESLSEYLLTPILFGRSSSF